MDSLGCDRIHALNQDFGINSMRENVRSATSCRLPTSLSRLLLENAKQIHKEVVWVKAPQHNQILIFLKVYRDSSDIFFPQG